MAKFAQDLGFKAECFSYNKKLAKGKAKVKKPLRSDIVKYLERNIPVILAVRAALLHNKEELKDLGHFIVVTKYKNNTFWYNDPYDGKRHRIKEDELLFAWHNNILDSSAYLLAIWQ